MMMLSSALVFVLAVGALARPDVSHLLKKERTLSSYEVPVNSVDGQYVTSRYAFQHNDGPFVKYFPSFVNGQRRGNQQQIYYISQSGQKQIPIKVTGGSYPAIYGGQGYGNVYYVSQGQGQGQGLGNIQYLSQAQGLDGVGNVQYFTQGGQGGLNGGAVQILSQGGGANGNVQYVSQGGFGGGNSNVNYVSQGGLGGGNNVNYVSQGGQGGLNFVSQGQSQGAGSINSGRVVQNQERVYFFSAPEDVVQHSSRLRINIVPTHTRNSNVIVVKAPSVGTIIPEVVVPSTPVVQEKTKVVVLVKENDHYVPLTVQAPAPITEGKAEVVVVKYHDKNDVARVIAGGSTIVGDGSAGVGGGSAVVSGGSGVTGTLTSQDKTIFTNTNLGDLLSRFEANSGNQGNAGSVGGSVLTLVNQVPQVNTYTVNERTGTVGNVNVAQSAEGAEFKSASDDQTNNINANQGSSGQSYELKSVEISGSTPSYNSQNTAAQFVSNAQNSEGFEIKSVSGDQGTNQGSSGQTYEVKTVKISGEAPGFNLQNVGGQLVSSADQQNLAARFGGDNSGYTQGYTIKTSEFIQNDGQSADFGNLDSLKKALGEGIEIVSISKGTLQGSAVGSNVQDSILRSLGISEDALSQGVSQNVNGGQVGSSFFQSSSSSSSSSSTGGSENARQIQIGNDVADVLSGSSLKA